jgi:hypothetical protein
MKPKLTVVVTHCADYATYLYQQKLALKFAHQRQSISRYYSLSDLRVGSLFYFIFLLLFEHKQPTCFLTY